MPKSRASDNFGSPVRRCFHILKGEAEGQNCDQSDNFGSSRSCQIEASISTIDYLPAAWPRWCTYDLKSLIFGLGVHHS